MYNNYNPYMYQPQPAIQRIPTNDTLNQTISQPYNQPMQINKPLGLLGKVVDNIEVVRAMDIPLDGSVSYYPLSNGSSIITKQLQADGTSKITIYKPVQEPTEEAPKYATIDDVRKEIEAIDLSELDDIKDELKDIKKQLKDVKKIKGD